MSRKLLLVILTTFLGLFFCAGSAHADSTTPEGIGWTPGSRVGIVLDSSSITRTTFLGAYEDGTVTVTGANGSDPCSQSTNNIINITGSRVGRLYAGESSWSMAPGKINVTKNTQVTNSYPKAYSFPYGQGVPNNYGLVTQTYQYTATISLTNGQQASGSAGLTVTTPAGGGDIVVDESLTDE
jgi:hypothetical protein